MSVIEDHERRLSALENLFKEKQPVPTKKISIAEFLKTKEPRTDVDTALAITYYLELTDGLANVNLEEIRAGFRKAATPIPPNLSETVRKNVAKGFLMDSGERKNGSNRIFFLADMSPPNSTQANSAKSCCESFRRRLMAVTLHLGKK